MISEYQRDTVNLDCSPTCQCGCLGGKVMYTYYGKYIVKEVTLKCKMAGQFSLGGLFGEISLYNLKDSSVDISDIYISSQIITEEKPNQVGNVIGIIENSTSNSPLTFSHVYYDNQTNQFPGIANGSSSDGSYPLPFYIEPLRYGYQLEYSQNHTFLYLFEYSITEEKQIEALEIVESQAFKPLEENLPVKKQGEENEKHQSLETKDNEEPKQLNG